MHLKYDSFFYLKSYIISFSIVFYSASSLFEIIM